MRVWHTPLKSWTDPKHEARNIYIKTGPDSEHKRNMYTITYAKCGPDSILAQVVRELGLERMK